MGKEIFISYAARDPDWPAEKVKALADQLRAKGNNVHLDQDYQAAMGRKVSPAEWIGWMEQRIDTAALILCLCSPRYKQAQKRDLNDPWGFGVAAESLDMALRLYDLKQHNEGWIWLVFGENLERKEVIPSRLYGRCPEYVIPREESELIKHASAGADASTHIKDTAGFAQQIAGTPFAHPRQRQAAQDYLTNATALWDKLSDKNFHNNEISEDSLSTPASFVTWIDTAAPDVLETAMRDIYEAFDETGRSEIDAQATVALYLLCACNLMDRAALSAQYAQQQVLSIPKFEDREEYVHLYAAVISTVLGGGELLMLPNKDGTCPMPAYTYGLKLNGDNTDALFERALYNAVFKTSEAATAALSDGDLSKLQAANLIEALKAKQKSLKRRKTLTLVVHSQLNTFHGRPPIAAALDVPVFTCADEVNSAVCGITAEQLVAMLTQMWQKVADKYPVNADVMKEVERKKTQAKLIAEFAEFLKDHPNDPDLLQLLKSIQSPETADKSLWEKGMKKAKELAETGENAEKVGGWIVKTYDFFKPIWDQLS